MNAYAGTTEDFTRQAEEWMGEFGAEFQHAASYIESVLMPEVRREAGSALRELAMHLDKWADQLDPQLDSPAGQGRRQTQ